MAITRRQFIAAGGAAGILLSTPLVAGTTAARVELVSAARAIALGENQRLQITDHGRQAQWYRNGSTISLDTGAPHETRIVAAALDGDNAVLLDRSQRRLSWFRPDGSQARHIDLTDLQEPADFVLNGDHALIADVHGHRLMRLHLRNESRVWLQSDRPLNGPASLAKTAERITLLPLGDRRLHHFTLTGDSLGSEVSTLTMPSGLTAVNDQLLIMDRCQKQLCWADRATPVLALPQTSAQQLAHLSWQPGSNLLISV